MNQADIDVFRDNLRLKKAFLKLDLDLNSVMEFMPYHLDIENRRLANLLSFVEKYQTCESRKVMELINRPFPPIFPRISPESDWYRFKLWLKGEPIRKKLRRLLPADYKFVRPEKLTETTAKIAFEKLNNALDEIGYGCELREGMPAKVMYEYLWETLEDIFDIDEEGGWVLDGCDGYCPGCFQRPWCDTGLTSYWPEDGKAGKMKLPEKLDQYLSASTVSLKILEKYKGEGKDFDEFSDLDQDSGYVPDPLNRGLYEQQSKSWEEEDEDFPF